MNQCDGYNWSILTHISRAVELNSANSMTDMSSLDVCQGGYKNWSNKINRLS